MSKVYSPPKIDYVKVRKSKTVPDQSLSVKEIVKRFVRGIPVDINRRQGVFLDQLEHDFEKLSRSDFGEKASLAEALSEHANQLQSELKEAERAQREKRKEASEKAEKAAKENSSEGAKA